MPAGGQGEVTLLLCVGRDSRSLAKRLQMAKYYLLAGRQARAQVARPTRGAVQEEQGHGHQHLRQARDGLTRPTGVSEG